MPTREEVEKYLTQRNGYIPSKDTLDSYCAALTHFAPPPSRIAGMTVEDIEREMLKDISEDETFQNLGIIRLNVCARVAHRLAREPAVDRDAGAKAAAWIWAKAECASYAKGCSPDAENAEQLWNWMKESERIGWRAVAAQQEKRDV